MERLEGLGPFAAFTAFAALVFLTVLLLISPVLAAFTAVTSLWGRGCDRIFWGVSTRWILLLATGHRRCSQAESEEQFNRFQAH